MIKKLLRVIILFFVIALGFFGCRLDGVGPGVTYPTKATLTFPANNTVCSTGTVISDSLTSVTLTWNKAMNTESYEVHTKNLLTNTEAKQTTTATQLAVTLFRNTPYLWYVVSKTSKTEKTAQSDTWKFYVAGVATTSYSPFPATLLTPSYGQSISAGTTTVNLTWAGSDVDNDIVSYDVYMGTTATSLSFKGYVAAMQLNVLVTANTTYYWKIVTKDALGNTSDSDVYKFSTL